MVLRLTEIERRRTGAAAGLPGLSPDKASSLKARLFAEKAEILARFDKEALIHLRPRRIYWASGAIAAVAILGLGLRSLLLPKDSLLPKIKFVSGEMTLENKKPAVGSGLGMRSELLTGKLGLAVVDTAQRVQVLLSPNTSLSLQNISTPNEKPHLQFYQTRGSIFVSVAKGQAELTIQTKAAEVRVVGTEFRVITNEQNTTVDVLEGTVQVEGKEKRAVTAGQRAVVSSQNGIVTLQKLTAEQGKNLHTLHNFLVNPSDRDQLGSAIIKTENQPSGPARLTLADIKKKYGKISRVNLTNGASYVGFFTLTGDKIQIITTQGIIVKPGAMLKDVRDGE